MRHISIITPLFTAICIVAIAPILPIATVIALIAVGVIVISAAIIIIAIIKSWIFNDEFSESRK